MTAPTSLRGYVTDDVYYNALQDVLEHVPDLTYPLSVPTYAKMRREPALAAVLAAYTLPLRRATWAIDPTGCRDEVVQLVADDLGLPIIGLDNPGPARTRGVSWSEHLRAALSHLTFGHSAFEMLAELRDSRARLVGLFERMQSTIQEIHIDQQGRLLGISQEFAPSRKSPQIPADRLVWYAHEPEGAALHGNSLLRPSFGYWLIKQELLRVAATSHRRFGMGVPTVEWATGANPTPAQMAEAQRAASAARVGDQSGLALPPGATLILKGLTGSAPDSIALLRYTDQQMSRSVLAGFLDLGVSETGSRALAESFIDLFTLSIGAVASEVADLATRQLAARIVEWNWNDEPVPRISVADVGTKHEITAEALDMLMRAGAITAEPALEAYVRRSYRLPQRDPDSPPPQPNPPASTPPAAANRKSSPPVRPAVTTKPRAAAPGKRRAQAAGQTTLPLMAAGGDGSDTEDHQADWETALAGFLTAWPVLAEPMVDELAGQAAAGVDAGDVALLAGLAVSAAATAAVTTALTEAMAALAVTSAARVVSSAADQGVEITAPDDPGADRVEQVAAVTAALIASGYASAATRKALLVFGPDTTAAEVADAVREALTEIGTSQAGLVGDNTGGALSAAQNAGRAAVFAEHPPKRLVAVEANDGPSKCGPCKSVDGTVYETTAEAFEDYPVIGYRACEGGSRCHGHLRAEWI